MVQVHSCCRKWQSVFFLWLDNICLSTHTHSHTHTHTHTVTHTLSHSHSVTHTLTHTHSHTHTHTHTHTHSHTHFSLRSHSSPFTWFTSISRLWWIMPQWMRKYRDLFKILISCPSAIYPEVGLLDHVNILRQLYTSFHNGCAILHPYIQMVHKTLLFSTSLPRLFLFCLFDDSHPNGCEVASHCGFDLHFPDD